MEPLVEVNETMPVYAVGFPFGAELALGKENPALNITRGTVTSLRLDRNGDVKLIQIDAEVNPGNSGGPVVDEKGHLVGVAVSKLLKARTVGFAVPVKPLAEILQGKVSQLAFDTIWVVKDHAEVHVEAQLVDPLGKLKDAALHYRLAKDKDAKGLPRPGKDGAVPLLDGAKRVWLKMSPGRGMGRFTLEGTGSDKVKIAYQSSYVNASGKTVVSPAALAVIDFTKSSWSDRLTATDPVDAKGKPYRVFNHPMKAGKLYVIDMRADPRELDPRVSVQDASGKSLAEDDGSGGLFDALILFSPPRDDEYRIVASSAKGMGAFTLDVREDTGKRLGFWGRLTLPGTLSASDPHDPIRQAPHQGLNVILEKGKSYAIEARSKDFDPHVRLENMARTHLKHEDVGGGGNSTLYYTPLQDGIYRVITTAFDSRAGKFEVTVRQLPALKQHEVGRDGLKLSGTLRVTDPVDVVNGRANNNRCQVFAVKMKAGQKYQIDLTSREFDAFVRVEDLRGRELAYDDDSGGMLNARLMFTPPAAGVYRVVAAGINNRFGGFELVVRAVP
jgi:hypothetical protein